jgi:RNAse (barnase) inhibitor barstar
MSQPALPHAHLEHVLKNVAAAGVYHLPQVDKSNLIAAAAANAFASFRVDLAGARDKGDLLAAIARAMGFPEWFGHNFDALADCLGDLSWRPAEGYLILLEHCDGIHGSAEEDFVTGLQVFEQAAAEWREQGIAFWCLVEMQADGIAWLPTGP